MKKILAFALLFVLSYHCKAQSITLINHSSCNVQYVIAAADGTIMPPSCHPVCKSNARIVTSGSSVTETPTTLTWVGTPPTVFTFIVAALQDASGAIADVGSSTCAITPAYFSSGCASYTTWTDLGGGNIRVDIY